MKIFFIFPVIYGFGGVQKLIISLFTELNKNNKNLFILDYQGG